MNNAQLIQFEAQSQAFNEGLYPLMVKVGAVELACAGTTSLEGRPELVAGGLVRDFGAEFSCSKAKWDEEGLPNPQIGDLVEIDGLLLMIEQVYGHQSWESDWSCRCVRRA